MSTTYKSEIELVEDTEGKAVPLQCQDEDGNGVDVSGCTVVWAVWEPEGGNTVLRVTCDAVDLSVGKVKYTLQSTDWAADKLQGGKEYKSALIASKTGYYEEFIEFTVKTIAKAPPAPS